jgi:hypothetical protein
MCQARLLHLEQQFLSGTGVALRAASAADAAMYTDANGAQAEGNDRSAVVTHGLAYGNR